jgi:hypothetical protein
MTVEGETLYWSLKHLQKYESELNPTENATSATLE